MIAYLLLLDPEDSTESVWVEAFINGTVAVGAEVEFRLAWEPDGQYRRKIVKWVRPGPDGKQEIGVWATRPKGVKIKPLWKTGWALLTYSAPSVLSVGDQHIWNYVDTRIPGDMPGQYLVDACPSRQKREMACGVYYDSISDILSDGWEPISVGERIGGAHGYGRLHAFKKLIKYNPGQYLDAEDIDLSSDTPAG